MGLEDARKRNQAAVDADDAQRLAQEAQQAQDLVDFAAYVAEVEPLVLCFSAALKRRKLAHKWRRRFSTERENECRERHRGSGMSFLLGGWRSHLSSYISQHKIGDVIFENRGDAGSLATFGVGIGNTVARLEVCIDGALPWRAYYMVPCSSDRAMPGDMTASPPYVASKELQTVAVHAWKNMRRLGTEQQGIEAIEQVIAATLDMFGIPDSELEV